MYHSTSYEDEIGIGCGQGQTITTFLDLLLHDISYVYDNF